MFLAFYVLKSLTNMKKIIKLFKIKNTIECFVSFYNIV